MTKDSAKFDAFRVRLLGLLACLLLCAMVSAVSAWSRYAELRELNNQVGDARNWQELAGDLQQQLATIHSGLLRLMLASSRDDIVSEGQRFDQIQYRIREILTCLHRGGRMHGDDAGVVVRPMAGNLRGMASALVPVCRDVENGCEALLRDMLREEDGLDSAGLRDRLSREKDRLDLVGLRAEEFVRKLRKAVAAAEMQRQERVGSLWTYFLVQGGATTGLMLLFAGVGLRAGRKLQGVLEQTAAAVTEANAGMERILEALPVGIAILDSQRMIRRVNLAATNLLCIEPGWQFSQHIRWDMFCERQNVELSEKPFRPEFEHEVRLQALDGRILDVVKSSAGINLQGETLQLEVFMDVTRRRRAEHEVLQEKARLESLLAGIDQGAALVDSSGTILEINDRLRRILDCPAGSHMAVHVRELFPGGILAGELAACFDALKQDPGAYPEDMHVETFREMALVVRVQPVVREGIFDGMIVSVTEVTEIVEARKRAEAASRAKSMFLANMSHEIRTPMNVIVGNAELLSCMKLDAQPREAAESIRQCAASLLVIVNDILDFSKIEAGMMRVVTAEVSLQALLEGVRDLFQEDARRKGLTLGLVTEGVPGTVRTDAGRLRQVLVNLVGNAVKFTHAGAVEMIVRSAGGSGRQAISFIVSDTGVGIPEDRQQQIFASFMQADGSLTREYGGTGLGLTIADSLVHLLGGTGIRVESQPGCGSSFSFTLIMETGGAQSLPEQPACGSERAPDFGELRVLAVEDNAFNRSLLQKMFVQLGISDVTMAVNGQDALDRMAVEEFSIVFMDIQMPVMDGLAATRALRRRGMTVPVVALTAHALESDQVRCLDAGMNAHLAKPYNLGALSDILRRWCS